jgi:hypothetical protein
MTDHLADRGREPSQPAVVGRLARDVGEQVTQPRAREAQEAPLGRTVEEDLRDRERDQLGIGDLRLAPSAAAGRQEIVHQHVKCGQKGVEFGEHVAISVVDVAVTTPNFDALVMSPRPEPPSGDSASLI